MVICLISILIVMYYAVPAILKLIRLSFLTVPLRCDRNNKSWSISSDSARNTLNPSWPQNVFWHVLTDVQCVVKYVQVENNTTPIVELLAESLRYCLHSCKQVQGVHVLGGSRSDWFSPFFARYLLRIQHAGQGVFPQLVDTHSHRHGASQGYIMCLELVLKHHFHPDSEKHVGWTNAD